MFLIYLFLLVFSILVPHILPIFIIIGIILMFCCPNNINIFDKEK